MVKLRFLYPLFYTYTVFVKVAFSLSAQSAITMEVSVPMRGTSTATSGGIR